MSDDTYKNKLSDAAYSVCRLGNTEYPFSGEYYDHWLQVQYLCICCEAPLFSSDDKFQSGCGWPSFSESMASSIHYLPDHSHGMVRTEIKCKSCDSHLGHVFDDGPTETKKRYCVNSVSLLFKKI